MEDSGKLLEAMQMIVTNLSQQADGHMIQSRIFNDLGFSKLSEKYAEHAEEERGYVIKIADRMMDLGAEVRNEAKPAMPVCRDPVEWVKTDLQISKDGLKALSGIMCLAVSDVTTYDILKDYYKDEEEDMYWGEQQLALIDMIGVQNWLVQQL